MTTNDMWFFLLYYYLIIFIYLFIFKLRQLKKSILNEALMNGLSNETRCQINIFK